MIQKLNFFLILSLLITGMISIFIPAVSFAAVCPVGYAHPLGSDGNPTEACDIIKSSTDCPSNKVDSKDKTKCLPLGNNCNQFANKTGICSDNPIVKRLNGIINVLGGLVGVVVVGTIILGGIQYAMAGDKAEAVSAAKKRIINGLIALFAFLFIFAFLQWLIPGGVFS